MYYDCSLGYQNNEIKTWIKHEELEDTSCLHELCTKCKGTGISKIDGTPCIHMISCPCPKCSPRC